jgi:UDP-N-acetylmuramoyl-tripeptide--D-alanyl-D-alanine ligase
MEVEMTTHTLHWIAGVFSSAGAVDLLENGLGPHGDTAWSGAIVDSREFCSGRVFFALGGENTDGHRFVEPAHERGCVAAIVDNGTVCARLRKRGMPYLLVGDCRTALQELAREYRGVLDARVIAITGSAGKTTTKEYVRRIVGKKYRVFANPGNFNSMIGVPLTILETDVDSEYLVSEVGANQQGEIGFLAAILRPDIAVITNVGDAHVGMFGSVDAIAGAKSELLEHVGRRGYAVLPADDVYFDLFAGKTRARVKSFGRSAAADFSVTDIQLLENRIRFDINGNAIELNAVGEYNALNACAAFAAGELCGVEHGRIVDALAETRQLRGRGTVHSGRSRTVIDESYNASPASLKESIRTLESMGAVRKIAVLGDMKELGSYAEQKHRRLGERLASSKLDVVFWLGDEGENVASGFEAAGGIASLRLFVSLEKLTEEVVAEFRDGDAVLVKASRALNLDRVVAKLLQTLGPETEN